MTGIGIIGIRPPYTSDWIHSSELDWTEEENRELIDSNDIELFDTIRDMVIDTGIAEPNEYDYVIAADFLDDKVRSPWYIFDCMKYRWADENLDPSDCVYGKIGDMNKIFQKLKEKRLI